MKIAFSFKTSVATTVGTLVFLFLFATFAHAQTAAPVSLIRKIVAETDKRIAQVDGTDDYSDVYVIELNVNGKGNQYPAVGTYIGTTKMYYTFGDREKNPYPNRLLKIVSELKRSSTVERAEIYFNSASAMILFTGTTEADDTTDFKLYFAAGKTVRFEKDGKPLSTASKTVAQLARQAVAEKDRFVRIFQASIQ